MSSFALVTVALARCVTSAGQGFRLGQSFTLKLILGAASSELELNGLREWPLECVSSGEAQAVRMSISRFSGWA